MDTSAIEIKKRILCDIADLEERFGVINKKLVEQSWREVLKKEKLAKFKSDCENLASCHLVTADRKDGVLQDSMRRMTDAEDQFILMTQNHNLNITNLIQLHNDRMNCLQYEFDKDLTSLKNEFNEEKQHIHELIGGTISELEALVKVGDEDNSRKAALEIEEADQDFENVHSKNMEEEHETISHLQVVLSALRERCGANLATYRTQTETKSREYSSNLARDENECTTVAKEQRIMQNLQNNLRDWRMRMKTNEKEMHKKNSDISDEYKRLVSFQMMLRKQFMQQKDLSIQKEADLARCSRLCKKRLNELMKQAEKILQIGLMCRKLETEREKICPGYEETSIDILEQNLLNQQHLLEGTEGSQSASQIYQELRMRLLDFESAGADERTMMDAFYKRFNKALLDKVALDKQNVELKAKNDQLKSLLQQFLRAVSISDHTMHLDPANNSILIINNRLQLNAAGIAAQNAQREVDETFYSPTVKGKNVKTRRTGLRPDSTSSTQAPPSPSNEDKHPFIAKGDKDDTFENEKKLKTSSGVPNLPPVSNLNSVAAISSLYPKQNIVTKTSAQIKHQAAYFGSPKMNGNTQTVKPYLTSVTSPVQTKFV